MTSTPQRVSPPELATQVAVSDVPVAYVSKRAAVSHSVPLCGPPVVATTKKDPSGDISTSRM